MWISAFMSCIKYKAFPPNDWGCQVDIQAQYQAHNSRLSLSAPSWIERFQSLSAEANPMFGGRGKHCA